jgi:membrane fusion protein (multidrug efflux system)
VKNNSGWIRRKVKWVLILIGITITLYLSAGSLCAPPKGMMGPPPGGPPGEPPLIAKVCGAVGFGGGPPPWAKGGFSMPVEAVTVTPRPLEVTIEAVGSLVANESLTVRPEVAGRVTEIAFTEGKPIKKGEKLFQIDDRLARAELKQAEANLRLAEVNNARFTKLSKSGAATKRTADEARAALGVGQAAVDVAKARLDYTTIKAPFDGVVGLRNVSPGDYVSIGQDLANFVSYDPMKVNFTVPETQATQLQVGQQIAFTVEAFPGDTFMGTVFALDPQLDVNSRAVNLRATIPNEDYRLKPGFFARVSLTVAEKPDALLIPENAIIPQGADKFVYRIDAEGAANLVPVTLGIRRSGEVEITEGLNVGDQVVISGQIKLQPGAKVTVKEPQPEQAQAAAP